MTTTDYVNVSRAPATLASGRVLAPGETGPADMRDDHDKALRDDGTLLKTDAPSEKGNG